MSRRASAGIRNRARRLARWLRWALAAGACLAGAQWLALARGFGDPPIALLDPQIGYYLQPGRSYVRFGNSIQINRHGFRSPDFDKSTIAAEDHVLLIGDSVVYGNHHIDQAETVAARLQARLRAQPTDQRAIVSSVAASGWSPLNQLAFYRKFGPFPARRAWLVLSSHDLFDPVDPVANAIPYRTAAPLNAIQDAAEAVAARLWSVAAGRFAKPMPVRSNEEAVRELLVLLKSHHVQVAVCLHLTAREIGEASDPSALVVLTRIANELEIPWFTTRGAYLEAGRQGRQVFYDDIHPSAQGAQTLADFLFERGQRRPALR